MWKIWAMNGQQLANRSRLTKNFVPAALRTRTSLVSGFKSSDSVRYCTQPLEQRTLILNHKVFFICIKNKLNYWFFFHLKIRNFSFFTLRNWKLWLPWLVNCLWMINLVVSIKINVGNFKGRRCELAKFLILILTYCFNVDFWNGSHAIPIRTGIVFTKIIPYNYQG